MVQVGIGGTVDGAHAAFTDLLQDVVIADACPDQLYDPLFPTSLSKEVPSIIRFGSVRWQDSDREVLKR